ncbi:ketoacyl-synthetase C-terminal extension domain-containing protein [Streptomyces zhihengii]
MAAAHAPRPDAEHPDRLDRRRTGAAAGAEAVAADTPGAPRGVSSFGISGTNAHVIVEEAPQTADADRPDDGPVLPLVVSGTDAAALRAQAGHWAQWLDARPAAAMRDIAYTSAVGRTHFETRAVVFADSAGDAAEALRAVRPGSGAAPGRSPSSSAAGPRSRRERTADCWSRTRCSATPWPSATRSWRR